jgi:hypothetical protein
MTCWRRYNQTIESPRALKSLPKLFISMCNQPNFCEGIDSVVPCDISEAAIIKKKGGYNPIKKHGNVHAILFLFTSPAREGWGGVRPGQRAGSAAPPHVEQGVRAALCARNWRTTRFAVRGMWQCCQFQNGISLINRAASHYFECLSEGSWVSGESRVRKKYCSWDDGKFMP